MRAAQRLQLDQMRMQQGGKGNGGVPARVTLEDSVREEARRRLLPAALSPPSQIRCNERAVAQIGTQSTLAGLRSPVLVPTLKSPPPFQKARPRSQPVKAPPQAHVGALRAASRSPSMVGEALRNLPNAGKGTRSPLPSRQVALRGSVAEVPTDERVSFRTSEERRAPRNRTPWRDRRKSQRGASPRR